MQFYLAIISHTPPWVFVLLGYLIYQGLRALQPRRVPIWRLLLVPGVFIVMGLSRMIADHGAGLGPPLAWLVTAAVLMPVGFVTAPAALVVDHATGTVTRPGSAVPLARNVTVFLLQYAVAVTAALHPDTHSVGALVARGVSGATAGYFIGWASAVLLHYRSARRQDAVEPTTSF